MTLKELRVIASATRHLPEDTHLVFNIRESDDLAYATFGLRLDYTDIEHCFNKEGVCYRIVMEINATKTR